LPALEKLAEAGRATDSTLGGLLERAPPFGDKHPRRGSGRTASWRSTTSPSKHCCQSLLRLLDPRWGGASDVL